MSYPATREPTTLVGTSVLLEMGVRGGQDPHEPAVISCLLGDILETAGTNLGEFADLEPFEVVVLHPGRTLLEKLILIHALAQRPETGALRPAEHRSGRHFYDIYQLLGDHRVLDLLAGRDQMMQVIASVQEIDRTYFNASDDTELRPKDGFAASPAFDPGTDVSLRLRAGYEATVPKLYFGDGPLPTWDEICGRIANLRRLL